MMDSRLVKFFISFLCVCITLSVIPLNFYQLVNADSIISNKNNHPALETICQSVENHCFSAEVKQTAQWACHSNLEIRFKNTGTVTIHDWYFTFDFDYAIENPYNCFVLEHKDNLYTIGNNNWNQDILPGQSVTVGFTASSNDGGDIVNMPSFYLLNTKTIRLTDNDLAYRYEEYSDWTYGYNGALILSNVSGNEIRDWTITFNANRSVKQADSLMLSINSDGSYTITNDGNNQNISKGQSYRIGIQGGEHDPSIPFDISNLIVSAKILALRLDDDNDNNGIADVLDIKNHGDVTLTPTVKPTDVITPIATDTPTPITATPTASLPTSTPIITVTPEPTITAMPTITASPTPEISVTPINTVTVIPTIMPTGIPDDIDYDTDSDSDGLPDDLEEYYGTNKDDPDSDGDGVNDFYELMLSTDPLVSDSNGNSDYDMDGLTNKRESELGTNPLSRDTDLDRLSDGEEVSLYGTDPNKYDTDEDGISDYNEIRLGSSPSFPDSEVKRYQTMEFEPSGEDSLTGVAKVIVSGYISGSMLENTKIRDIYGKDLHTSSIEALVGDPVNIESTGEFDSMTITFEYTDNLNEKNLRVMWYDENNYEYVVLNNYTLNRYSNTISITTDHFSKYMLIDEEVWVNTWINACYEVDHTTNMFIGGYLRSPSSYKDYMIDRFGDDDHDGLANVWEEGGMINNIGHVVHSNPGKRLSDEDSLADGVEMGKLSSLEDIFERSPYTTYRKNGYPVSAGSRWEDFAYFKCISDVELSDSDYDGALDGEDATSYDPNGVINYILMGKDFYGDIELMVMKYPYLAAFALRNEDIVFLDIFKGSDFDKRLINSGYNLSSCDMVQFALTHLQCNLTERIITDQKAYSRAEKVIIIAHGMPNWLQFGPDIETDDPFLTSKEIHELSVTCEIGLLDIQACHCGRPEQYEFDGFKAFTCVAFEFAKKSKIESVYAWTNQAKFIVLFYFNYSNNGGEYREIRFENGGIYHRKVETAYYFGLLPVYYPLQY